MISKNDAIVQEVQKRLDKFTVDEISFIISQYQNIVQDQLLKNNRVLIHGIGSIRIKVGKPRIINTSKLNIGKETIVTEPFVSGEYKPSDTLKIIMRDSFLKEGLKKEEPINE